MKAADLRDEYDIVVVGAGPAGLAAATSCARAGLSTVLFDEQASPGGHLSLDHRYSRLPTNRCSARLLEGCSTRYRVREERRGICFGRHRVELDSWRRSECRFAEVRVCCPPGA